MELQTQADGEGSIAEGVVVTMPRQKPHQSKQDYATPADFIQAVKRRLHIKAFTVDLAADLMNRKADRFLSVDDDALSLVGGWHTLTGRGWGWLNPPFTNIDPWAAGCAETSADGGSVAFLVPAGVGANWYRDHLHGKALVLALNGRLCFIDDWENTIDPSPRNTTGRCYSSEPLYPKDCILALFSPLVAPGFDVWTWKDQK